MASSFVHLLLWIPMIFLVTILVVSMAFGSSQKPLAEQEAAFYNLEHAVDEDVFSFRRLKGTDPVRDGQLFDTMPLYYQNRHIF